MRCALALWLLLMPAVSAQGSAGVVVESVEEGFAAQRAGLRTGDVLLSWERPSAPPANPDAAQGTLDSPFDLEEVESEQVPRAELTLRGTRDGRPLVVRLPEAEWRLVSRPQLEPPWLEAYEDARRMRATDEEQALARWRELALELRRVQDPRSTWLFARLAAAAAERRRWPLADAAFEEAAKDAASEGRLRLILVQSAAGRTFEDRSSWDAAVSKYEAALAARRGLGSPSLLEARLLGQLG